MNALSSRLTTVKDFLATQHRPTLAQLKNLVSWNYYTQNPVPSESPLILLTAIIIIVIVAVIIGWWLRVRQLQKTAPIYNTLLDQLPTLLIFIVAVSIFYAFCWAQSVQYLSSRLVLLSAGLITLGWIFYLVIYCFRVLPVKKRDHLEKERFFRYLPKKKR